MEKYSKSKKSLKPLEYYGTNRVLHPDGGVIFKCEDGICYENKKGEVCVLVEDPHWDDLRVFPKYRKMICSASTSNEYYHLFDLDELAEKPFKSDGSDWTFCERVGADCATSRYMFLVPEDTSDGSQNTYVNICIFEAFPHYCEENLGCLSNPNVH